MMVSNPSLLIEKKKLIEEYSSISAEKVSCSYHGLGINFFSQRSEFRDQLKSYLPKEWLRSELQKFNVLVEAPETFGYSLESWSDEHSQDCYSYNNNSLVVQRDFAARLDGDNAYLICPHEIGDGFFNFLRWFISERLIQQNSFVVHASCVLNKQNEAFLFLGHSGAGKTTMTELAGARDVLGDDMNLLSINNNEVVVYPGAIGGRFLSTIGYDRPSKLKKIFWLKQDNKNAEVLLDQSLGSLKLLASFANLHWPTLGEERTEKLLDFCSKVASKVEVSELSFEKNSKVWELIDP